MAFYRVSLHSTFASQDIVNLLYYADTLPVLPGEWEARANELAEELDEHLWPLVGTSAWGDVTPVGCVMHTINVMPLQDTDFLPAFTSPISRDVNHPGLRNEATDGPATCAIIRFTLARGALTAGLHKPRRGYLAKGPVPSAWISDGMVLGEQDRFNDLADVLAQPISAGLAGANPFQPRRYGEKQVGPVTLRGFADVIGASVRPLASFRRSRIPTE